MRKSQNFKAEGTAPAKALSWGRKTHVSEQQKATVAAEGERQGEKEEVGLERPERGRACRALKVLRRMKLSSLCVQGPAHSHYSWGSGKWGGMSYSQNNPKWNYSKS